MYSSIEQAHQLGDRDGRVRVVQLNGPVRSELRQGLLAHVVNSKHVLQ